MKKGFTLIELLAVIVILAIIAIIAVPIVLNIISDTKKSASLRSADMYLDAVEFSIAQSTLNNKTIKNGTYNIMNDGNICLGTLSNNICDGEILKVEVKGEKPTGGYIEIIGGNISNVELVLNDKTIVKNNEGKLVYGQQSNVEEKLAPGLYDENDNLLISWEDLTSTDYKSIAYSVLEPFYDVDIDQYVDLPVEVTGAILNVDENGILTSTYDEESLVNKSSEHLVGKLVIDDSVTSIGNSAFEGCTGLTSINIPSSVTSIGYYAFRGCTGLTSINIPSSVTSIGYYTFSGCTGLTSITIPSSVTSIGNSAFEGCTGLTSINIPSSVTSIGNYAFSGCTGLKTIIVDKNNPKYDSRNNSNAIIETETNTLVVGCKNTTIPESVTNIRGYAFDGCTGLTSITIPSSVTSIEQSAFRGCTGLTSINIPSSVTSIGNYAFSGCTGLTSITIPKSVTSIGWNAFRGCTGLTSITIPSSVTSIGNYAFDGCTGLTTIYYKGTATGSPWGAPKATVESNF